MPIMRLLSLLFVLSVSLTAEEALDHFNPVASDFASKVFKSIHGNNVTLTLKMQAVPDVAVPPDASRKSYVIKAQDPKGTHLGTIRLALSGERLVQLDYVAATT